MTKFRITRIDNGVFAKDVNPYGEYKMDFPWPDQEFDEHDYSHSTWAIMQANWETAEASLQEYPLTEESLKMEINTGRTNLLGLEYFIQRQFYISQEITGEIVIENGVKKIKI